MLDRRRHERGEAVRCRPSRPRRRRRSYRASSGEAAAVDGREEAVDRAHPSFERRRSLAEPLRGAPGDRDAEHLAAGVELGLRGGVDHDALAGAGSTDDERRAPRSGDASERVALLVAQSVAADGVD